MKSPLRQALKLDLTVAPWSDALMVAQLLHEHGHAAVCVGGCIRDVLLQRPVADVDLATSASPDQVMQLFPRAIGVGAQFGVVVVPTTSGQVEVASFRADHAYIDGRRPTGVELTDEATDTARRDFTINALVFDPFAGELRDHTGGLADLEQRVLRVVGDAQARLQEDRLRVLRALRFAAQCQLTIEPASAEALRNSLVTGLSRERIWDEWDKAGRGAHRKQWWQLVHTYGLASAWCPLLADVDLQDSQHDANYLDRLPSDPVMVQAFTLRHLAVDVLTSWLATEPISRERRRSIAELVRWHDMTAVAQLPDPERRRLLVASSAPQLVTMWQILNADADPIGTADLAALINERQALLQRPQQALLTGADLKRLGVQPGPMMGQLLRDLLDAQLAGEVADAGGAETWVAERLS